MGMHIGLPTNTSLLPYAAAAAAAANTTSTPTIVNTATNCTIAPQCRRPDGVQECGHDMGLHIGLPTNTSLLPSVAAAAAANAANTTSNPTIANTATNCTIAPQYAKHYLGLRIPNIAFRLLIWPLC
nr:unnamed protein product [Spirometra erinaceieuropaei]